MDELARDVDRRVTAALETEAARLARELPARVTTRARVGSAGAQTLAALDEDATVDLVVTGSHGRTGLRRVLLGSVAEKIVRHAKCPVLVARKR
jgi:nucleotide-binding universal stress UspA family protein